MPLQTAIIPLQSHKHLSLRGNPEMRCLPSLSGQPEQYQEAGSKGRGLGDSRVLPELRPRAEPVHSPRLGAAVAHLALPPRGHCGRCRWPQNGGEPRGPSPAASRAQETVRGVLKEAFAPCQAIAGCQVTVTHSVTSILPHSPQTSHSCAQSMTCATFDGAIPQAESLGS